MKKAYVCIGLKSVTKSALALMQKIKGSSFESCSDIAAIVFKIVSDRQRWARYKIKVTRHRYLLQNVPRYRYSVLFLKSTARGTGTFEKCIKVANKFSYSVLVFNRTS